VTTTDLLDLRDDIYRRPLVTALERVGIERGWTVADVGAGNGDVSVALATVVGETGRVYSIDIDPRRRNDVASRASEHSQVVAITQSVEDLALPEPIDLAFCRFLLLGIPSPRQGLTQMMKAVRTGGWVVAQEPITSAGRVGHRPISADAPSILHPDLGLDLPSLFHAIGLELTDAWAESPVGYRNGPVVEYLEEMTEATIDNEVVVVPPLMTVVGRKTEP
jgi:ubiquinone/menaquinone biosynthesis C-methylase UbiE